MGARAIWSDARGIDRQAARYDRRGHRDLLRDLIMSVPLPDAVRLAKRYGGPDPAGHRDGPLLTRLAAADEALVGRVAAAAGHASRSVHPIIVGDAAWLSFGVGAPVLTHTSYESPGITRVAMLRDGSWHDFYRGELHHYAVACVDEHNVIAVRDEPGGDRALVHYTPGVVRTVMHGAAVTGARPAGTAAGFVTGSALGPSAIVAGPRRAPDIMDLSPFGLETAHRLAVSPDGRAIAFGGSADIVVTDARMEYLIARSVLPVPRGPVRELAFTGPDELVACGERGGLSRWRTAPHEALTLEAVGEAPLLGGLFAIPAWGVVVGRAGGEGRHRFFDPATLEPADMPRPLVEAEYEPQLVHTVAASADGRFAAVGGYDRTGDFALTLHDFHHPPARLLRPLASLTEDDLATIGQAAADTARYDADVREVLALLRAAAAHRLGVG